MRSGAAKARFPPHGAESWGNHSIFMKCSENHYIITKMGYFGRNPAKGGNTLKDCLLNITLFQPSETPTRARDSAIPMFLHAKMGIPRGKHQFYHFLVISPDFMFSAPKAHEKHKFGQAFPCSNQCLAAGGPKGAQSTSKR